jgi:putative intracellular protease/amidase
VHIAILTFEGFNELDSLIAFGILNRVRKPDWRVSLACPTPQVTSMNGVAVHAQASLEDASAADAVIVGSGVQTRAVVADAGLMARLRLDPKRQLLAAQCSGTLVLAKLGLLGGVPACTDLTTKPWVEEAGVSVLDQPFFAKGNVADRRRLSRVPVPRDMVDRAPRQHRRGEKCHGLRGAGRREGLLRRPSALEIVRPYL